MLFSLPDGSLPNEKDSAASRSEPPCSRLWKRRAWTAGFLALAIGLRVIALDSDAYPRLSWSSALLTDEGFYLHNARNSVLFGHEVTDEFNNRLLMPLLHYVQVAVFSIFGVGAVQARAISVVFGLLTLVVFFAGLRRAFGERVAWIGVVLLGLDHINLLYGRLALMDTPACLPLVCAWYAFGRGTADTFAPNVVGARLASPASGREKMGRALREGRASPAPTHLSSRGFHRAVLWLILCGVLLGVAYTTRGLVGFFFPAPLVALWLAGKQSGSGEWKRQARAVGGGLAAALLVYGLLWYLPNRDEMARVSAYYLHKQLMPHSIAHLWQNVTHAAFGEERGLAPYLFRHSPAQFLLALAGLVWWRWQGREAFAAGQTASGDFLVLWLLLAWGLLSVVSYSPSRYYVLFYPAMAAISALTLANLRSVWDTIVASRWGRVALSGFIAFQLGEAFWQHRSATGDLVVSASAVLIAAGSGWGVSRKEGSRSGVSGWLALPAVWLMLWAMVNAGWLGDWLTHLSYRQRDADRWLADNLPPNSVLIGDAAPGLCLNNRFVAVPVIWGLCNDKKPLEPFAAAPRFVVTMNDKILKEWNTAYPGLVTPEHQRKQFAPIVRFPVGVYIVP